MEGTRSDPSAQDAGQDVDKPSSSKATDEVFRAAYKEEKARWAGLSERLK